MRDSRFTDERSIEALKETDAGAPTDEVCHRHGVSSGARAERNLAAQGPHGSPFAPCPPAR